MHHPTIPPVSIRLPDWLPVAVRHYLDHTASGTALRELARRDGVAPSTVMRQVRLCEQRRDDPLVDAAFEALRLSAGSSPANEDAMTAPSRHDTLPLDPALLAAEARRVLRRLAEPSAVLAVAPDLPRAAVLREGADGKQTRLCTLARNIALAFAVNDWIAASQPAPQAGRIAAYRITAAGRAALRRLLSEEDMRAGGVREAQFIFAEQHRDMTEREVDGEEGPRRARFNAAESPVTALGRKLDKDGKPYLTHDLVRVAERLREDFELAQMGPRVAQNWERFLTGGDRGAFGPDRGVADGPKAARDRVTEALRDLGPGLGDVALRVCCFLEGIETAERRLGWAARSGKIVLRIALQRLKRHYEETRVRPLIG
jgi:DNA-binding MarR family transcriptional regulator